MTIPPAAPASATSEPAGIRTTVADVFEVICSPGEMVLAFGTVKGDAESPGVVAATLESRIILSPHAAKRLAILLDGNLLHHRARYGPLSPPPFARELLHEPSGSTAEQARRLMQLMESLGVDYGLERSFKISHRSFAMNRFVVLLKKDDVGAGADQTMVSLFQHLRMPQQYLQRCGKLLPAAEFVHFGLEEGKGGCFYKSYLEFPSRLRRGADGMAVTCEPFVVAMGYKWDPFDTRRSAVTRYTCHPLLSFNELLEKMASAFREKNGKAAEAARDVLVQVTKTLPAQSIVYLEVGEETNQRKSFDLNFYGGDFTIGEMYPYLLEAGRHFDLPADRFREFCQRIGEKKLGHLSGGTDREGHDFISVYYGMQGRRLFCRG